MAPTDPKQIKLDLAKCPPWVLAKMQETASWAGSQQQRASDLDEKLTAERELRVKIEQHVARLINDYKQLQAEHEKAKQELEKLRGGPDTLLARVNAMAALGDSNERAVAR